MGSGMSGEPFGAWQREVDSIRVERDKYKRERDELLKRAKAIWSKEYAPAEEAELYALVKYLDESGWV